MAWTNDGKNYIHEVAMSDKPKLIGWVAYWNRRTEPTMLSDGTYDDLKSCKVDFESPDGYIDLSKVPAEAIVEAGKAGR